MAARALHDQEERKVQVNRLSLIETLKANRERHIANHAAALRAYKDVAAKKLSDAHGEAIKSLEKNLARNLAELEDFDPEAAHKRADYLCLVQQINVELKVPRNYSKEYDAAIAIAEWDVRDVLELSHAEFQCFVRDVWEWSDDFRASTMSYVGSR